MEIFKTVQDVASAMELMEDTKEDLEGLARMAAAAATPTCGVVIYVGAWHSFVLRQKEGGFTLTLNRKSVRPAHADQEIKLAMELGLEVG